MNQSKLFQSSRNRWVNVEDFCGITSASLLQVVDTIQMNEHTPKQQLLQRLQLLKQCANKLAKIDAMAKCRTTIAKDLFDLSKDSIPDSKNIQQAYNNGVEVASRNITKAAASNHPDLKSILKTIRKVSGANDEDIEEHTTAQQAPLLCPILRCALDNPMKNAPCGHVYSLKGAIQLLMQHNAPRGKNPPAVLAEVPGHYSAKCPQFGCSKLVRPSTLKRDYATELSQRQQQSATQARESMDIEELCD